MPNLSGFRHAIGLATCLFAATLSASAFSENLSDVEVNRLRGREPAQPRFPLYCRGEHAQAEFFSLLSYQTLAGGEYQIRWASNQMARSTKKADLSKKYFGLNKGQCAWEDRPISATEADQLCFVMNIRRELSDGAAKVEYWNGFSISLLPENEVWKLPAHSRKQPLTCLDIEFEKRERFRF